MYNGGDFPSWCKCKYARVSAVAVEIRNREIIKAKRNCRSAAYGNYCNVTKGVKNYFSVHKCSVSSCEAERVGYRNSCGT